MEEFFSSEKFEKMAREYNNKYMSVAVLNVVAIDKDEVVSLIADINTLFVSLNTLARSEVFDKYANEVWSEVQSIIKKCEIELPVNQKVQKKDTYQSCINLLTNILLHLLDLAKKTNFQEFLPLIEKILKAINAYFRGF